MNEYYTTHDDKERMNVLDNLNEFMKDSTPVLEVACFIRVSTSHQTTDNQLLELIEVCNRNKWHITDIYEETVSGTKGVDERSELSRLMKDASRKKFSKVVVWSVDRLSRSMKSLVNVLSELEKHLEIENAVLVNNKGLLKNKTFMLTGKLNGVSRAEAKSLIEKNSGKIISNVNKKLDYLIIGEKPTIKKVTTAKQLNIRIINQKEWIEMLNKTG